MFSTKLLYLLLAMATIGPIQAVQYTVTNNATGKPGGTRFENEIGIPYSQQTIELASEFTWKTFQQNEGDRRYYDQVIMMVNSFKGVAFTLSNSIQVSSEYVANYTGDVRIEIVGDLYHEMTHVWQWHGNKNTPFGLMEGIADYVRLKAGWAKEGVVRDGMKVIKLQLILLSIGMGVKMGLLLSLML
ncbi:Basic secretory protein [Melia azedarach]|uniref:Basic secretory protein n=1 Tax=Melia azedarach TaxID=155640 RepID=A0ACC1XYI9_MELAZ|nr:Basic secretory protein [Melia azedarach]